MLWDCLDPPLDLPRAEVERALPIGFLSLFCGEWQRWKNLYGGNAKAGLRACRHLIFPLHLQSTICSTFLLNFGLKKKSDKLF